MCEHRKFNCFTCLLYNSVSNILPPIRNTVSLCQPTLCNILTKPHHQGYTVTHVLTMISFFSSPDFLVRFFFAIHVMYKKKIGIITSTSEEHLNNNQPSSLCERDQNNFITIILCKITRNHCK